MRAGSARGRRRLTQSRPSRSSGNRTHRCRDGALPPAADNRWRLRPRQGRPVRSRPCSRPAFTPMSGSSGAGRRSSCAGREPDRDGCVLRGQRRHRQAQDRGRDPVEAPSGLHGLAGAHAEAVRIRDLYRRQGRLAHYSRGQDRPAAARAASKWSSSSGRARSPRSTTSPSSATAVTRRAQLRDVISTSQSGWLDIFKSAAFYDPERIERDQELLRRHYLKNRLSRRARARGRRPSRTRRAPAMPSPSPSRRASATPSAPSASAASSRRSTPAGCTPRVAITPGNTFNLETVDKSVETLTLALSRPGPGLRAGQGRSRSASRRRRTIDVAFLVEQGPRILVERIDIVGNKKTKDFVIRREFAGRRGRPRQRLPDRARAQARAGAWLLQERGRASTRPARRRTRWSSPSRWSRRNPTTCRSASATRWPRAWSATSRSPSETSSATASGCA